MLSRRAIVAAISIPVLLVGTVVGVGLGGNATTAYGATTMGCGKAPTLTSGTKTIQSGGQNRTYILDIPTNYDRNHAYRLIFGLHWLNGTANDVATGGSDGAVFAFYGQKQLSNNSTIFVAPQGLNNGWANTGGQDVTLVDNILSLVEGGLCVDTTEVFAMGWSFGGAMSFALACARPAVFRAVVVYSGANLSGCSGGTQPVAYFGIHGIHDSVLNISNGRTLRDTFVRNNGCTAQTPREPTQGSLTHITTAYSGCRAGFPVQWAAFDGDHTPTPVDGSTATSGARTWTSGEANRFLAQFQSTTTPPPTPTTGGVTTPPTPTPPATTGPATGTCRVTVQWSPWDTGLTANFTVANLSNTPINGWQLRFTLASGQVIQAPGWNASYTPTSGAVTASNLSFNTTIGANATTTLGFNATHTGNADRPTGFTLNGATCSVA